MKQFTIVLFVFALGLGCGDLRDEHAWAEPRAAQVLEDPGESNTGIYVNGKVYSYTESGLNAALLAAAGMSSVRVPRGKIQLSSPLRIPSDSRVYWDGVTLSSGGFDGDLVDVTDVSNVSFDGKLTIDGTGAGTGSASEGLNIASVKNFSFSDIEIRNIRNNCMEIIGSSHIRGSGLYGIRCGSPKPPGGGGDTLYIDSYHSSGKRSKDVSSTDIQISQVDADTTGQQNCVFISGDDAAPTLRVNIDSINAVGCADEGVELDYCRYCNIGKVIVKGAAHEGVLLRQTSDDQINSVICEDSGLAICVDVARYKQVGAPSDGFTGNITINQVVADGVNRDPVNGAAVRISNSDPSNRISNVVLGQIITTSSTRGFYCVADSGSIVEHVSLSNINVSKSVKDGILINGCSDVEIGMGSSFDNGQSGKGFAAVHGTNATDVLVAGLRLFDDQKSKTQSYGILTDGTSDRWTIGAVDAPDDLEIVSGILLAGSHNTVNRDQATSK